MRAIAAQEDATDRVAEDLYEVLAHVMRASQGDVFHLASELDLTLTQLRVMHVLVRAESEPSLMDLAAAIDLSVAATGRAADSLVRAGFVARREDEADRRVKRHSLTSEGRRALDRLAAQRRAGVERFVAQLDRDDRRRLAGALEPLAGRLRG